MKPQDHSISKHFLEYLNYDVDKLTHALQIRYLSVCSHSVTTYPTRLLTAIR